MNDWVRPTIRCLSELSIPLPDLATADWMPEPTEQLGLEPMPGEMLWSALMSPDAQSDLLEWVDSQN